MSKKSTSKISDRFDEYPEITQADIDRARFRVNLQDTPRKQRVNIMLDTGVIAFFKSRLANAAIRRSSTRLLNRRSSRKSSKQHFAAL